MTPAYVLSGESDCKKIFVFRDEYATAFHWFGLEWSLHPPIVVSVLPSLQTSYRARFPRLSCWFSSHAEDTSSSNLACIRY
jgi:hypothetical protein